jgi:hypothetical protein
MKAGDFGLEDNVRDRHAAGQDLVDPPGHLRSRKSEPAPRIPLGILIDQKHALLMQSKRGGEVDRRRRLPTPRF